MHLELHEVEDTADDMIDAQEDGRNLILDIRGKEIDTSGETAQEVQKRYEWYLLRFEPTVHSEIQPGTTT